MKPFHQKDTFKFILLTGVLLLIFLPLVVTFNDLLTRFFESITAYKLLQEFLVPLEAKVVGAILIPLGFKYVAYLDGMKVNGVNIGLSWNCLGWQSLLLFTLTLIPGLRGNFTLLSRFEALLSGLLSLFLVNIARITFTTILAVLYRPLFTLVFHDYLAALLTVSWLLLFWWFSYSFILEERKNDAQGEIAAV